VTEARAPLTQEELQGLEVDDLLRRGMAAARAGDNEDARLYLEEAARRNPERADIWVELAGVTDDLEKKRDYFQRALILSPANEQARLGLQRVSEKLGKPVEEAQPVETLYCHWHPDRETLLRCNKCGKPICTECAIRHPVGLRCKECAQVVRSPIYAVSLPELGLAGIVGLALGTGAGFLMTFIAGFWFVTWIIGPIVGSFIAEAMSRVIRYKRGVAMQVLAGLCIALGVLIISLWLSRGLALLFNPGILIYLLFAIGAAAARLR
jgi:tetratricopeptide (TPR) repeat protein